MTHYPAKDYDFILFRTKDEVEEAFSLSIIDSGRGFGGTNPMNTNYPVIFVLRKGTNETLSMQSQRSCLDLKTHGIYSYWYKHAKPYILQESLIDFHL